MCIRDRSRVVYWYYVTVANKFIATVTEPTSNPSPGVYQSTVSLENSLLLIPIIEKLKSNEIEKEIVLCFKLWKAIGFDNISLDVL